MTESVPKPQPPQPKGPVIEFMEAMHLLETSVEKMDDTDAEKTEAIVEMVKFDIVPKLVTFTRLWYGAMMDVARWRTATDVAMGRVALQLTELKSDMASMGQRLELAEDQANELPYETALTEEDAETMRQFVLASIQQASELLPAGDRQTAFVLKGKELLDLIEASTIGEDEGEEGEESEDDADAEAEEEAPS
jgi:hypothetical protein